MNLFWETRALTQSREDHLTCFVAAVLDVDPVFRAGYEALVLGALASGGTPPRIASVRTQASFAEQRSVPDMVLTLEDGRIVLCEHKIDASETTHLTSDGQTVKQLERYLAIPGIAGLAYFRSAPAMLARDVLEDPLYLRPASGAHFVWRDLYGPLEAGTSDVARWLRAGFDRLGFTPPVPHIGELSPHEAPGVRENQRNFNKLWRPTWAHLETRYNLETGSRCEIYLTPLREGLVKAGYVSPLAQGGSLLRIRVDTSEADVSVVRQRLEEVAGGLTVLPETKLVAKAGRTFVDLLAPLRLILAGADDVPSQEARLYGQVVPVFDALDAAREQHPRQATSS